MFNENKSRIIRNNVICFKYIICDSGHNQFLIRHIFFLQHTCFPASFVLFHRIICIHLELLQDFKELLVINIQFIWLRLLPFLHDRKKINISCPLKTHNEGASFKAVKDSVSSQGTVLHFHLVGGKNI